MTGRRAASPTRSSCRRRSTRRPRSGSQARSTTPPRRTRRSRSSGSTPRAGCPTRCARSSRTWPRRRCRWWSTSLRTAPVPARPAPTSPRLPTWRRWLRRPTSARRPRSRSGRVAGAATSTGRSRTTRPPRCGRSPRTMGATRAGGRARHQGEEPDGRGGQEGGVDRPDRVRPGGAAPSARRLPGQGAEGPDAAHGRASDREPRHAAAATSCSRSSSIRTSPTCCS